MAKKKKNIPYALDHESNKFLNEVREGQGLYLPLRKFTFSDLFSNPLLLVYAIREGISIPLFKLIRQYTEFTDKDWANFLGISLKSLQRYLQSGKNFKPSHSERIIELAEVTRLGLEVFGDMKKFRLWLDSPSFALGKMKPIELLKDSYGKELVVKELVSIQYGIFA